RPDRDLNERAGELPRPFCFQSIRVPISRLTLVERRTRIERHDPAKVLQDLARLTVACGIGERQRHGPVLRLRISPEEVQRSGNEWAAFLPHATIAPVEPQAVDR